MQTVRRPSASYGVQISNNKYATFSQLVFAPNTGSEIYITAATNLKFTNNLIIDLVDCNVARTNPSLANFTCATQGTSDHTLTTGISMASTYTGKITNDDASNAFDSSGQNSFEFITDWLSFANFFRAWGATAELFKISQIWEVAPSALA